MAGASAFRHEAALAHGDLDHGARRRRVDGRVCRMCTAVSEPSGCQTGTAPRLIGGKARATTRRRPTMRAHSYKRFAIVIGAAAAGVMALGAQTATSSTGEPVDSVPPDLQYS